MTRQPSNKTANMSMVSSCPSSTFYSSGDELAVIISIGKANDKGHTSVVYCLEVIGDLQREESLRVFREPFRLHDDHGLYIWCNHKLRKNNLRVGSVIGFKHGKRRPEMWFCNNTTVKMEMNKVISQLHFGDQHYGGVAYRGISEAFPNAVVLDHGRVKQRHGHKAPEFALVGIKSAYTCDERIVFRTQLDEECNLKLNCREYKQCTIDMVPLPVRAPSSEEDVGDLILIKVEESTASGQGVCEGVLIRAPELLGRYDMDRVPRGKCVIINNVDFQDKSYNRVGGEHDERELVKLFEELHFEVDLNKDLKWDQMRKVAVKYADFNHSHFAAFVMIIMSHGDNLDKIFGVDMRAIGVEDLTTEFKAANCPTLEGKPKLFFINACRGSSEELQSSSTYQRGACTDKCILGDSTLPRSTCPQETDFLLAFSSAPGYQSYRFSEYGSLFIQVLVEVIQKFRNQSHLLDMLTEVIKAVIEKGNENGLIHQVPTLSYTLRHQVWLRDFAQQ